METPELMTQPLFFGLRGSPRRTVRAEGCIQPGHDAFVALATFDAAMAYS
ncbi:hypothetical protein SNL152K_6240 [Streptomyces sp. NL15-2K]|nr:hypothetical protein SNL152K_6240 [Streptomyces sp. NL15-2K]